MAKLIIVCVIAMLAVASAAFTLDSFNPLVAPIEEEAMTCPTNTCVVSGGDCLSTSTDYKYCPQNEFENTTNIGSGSCNCRTAAQFLAVGASCTAGAVTNQCGPYATCSVMPGGTTADYKCYGRKMIGDTCTIGSSECAVPRVCSSGGLCTATLAAAATCYNATTYKSLGLCPLNQYCPAIYTANQVCTDLIAAGASCSTAGAKCVPYTVCGLSSSASSPTCDRYVFGTLAAGVDVNNLGALGCASYLANTTSGKCVDYDAEVAKWNAAFPSPSTIACTYSTDCNLPGVTLAQCTCTAKATGNTPYCLRRLAPSVSAAQAIAIYKQGGIIETGFAAGCESSTPQGAEFVNNAAYCASKWASTFLAAVCPTISSSSASFSCYDESLGLCNGASALQSSVVMTMIVALVAFFTTQ
jgi:hypothetical protein